MKGVIVQVGHPKSIVLFNNGKIKTIPTPSNCHLGMVVTVKFNNLLKVIIITLVAVLLIALGVFIGARYLNSPADTSTNGYWPGGHGRRHMMDSNEFWPGRGRHRQMMEQGR